MGRFRVGNIPANDNEIYFLFRHKESANCVVEGSEKAGEVDPEMSAMSGFCCANESVSLPPVSEPEFSAFESRETSRTATINSRSS